VNDVVAAVRTVADLLAVVRRQAEHSADRYDELAEAFAVSNNQDTEGAFRELAEGGRLHAAEIPPPTEAPGLLPAWGDLYPEISDPDSVHYLMPPWHAFDLAYRHEAKALALIEDAASTSPDPLIRAAAVDLARRQQDRVEAILARRDSFPQPPPGWWEDEDGPNWDSEF
jgi:hypothetical protein